MRKEEYTKNELLKAILKLLQTKKIDDISITELVNTAKVGRASFYRNYTNKKDILIKHMEFLFKEWGKEFEKANNPDVNGSLLRHFWKEKDFYLAIYNAQFGYLIYDSMKEAMNIKEKKSSIEIYLASWYAGSVYGFIDGWMKNGMKESPDELVVLMEKLFKK